MKITTSRSGNEVKLSVVGCLDTASTPEFSSAVDAVANSAASFVFDFSELEFIASSALRKLVSFYKVLAANGGRVAICGMHGVVKDVFEVTGLIEVFEVR